jgi:hypothetical protein
LDDDGGGRDASAAGIFDRAAQSTARILRVSDRHGSRNEQQTQRKAA